MEKIMMLRMLQSIYFGKLLITNPDRFFAELSGRNPNLLAPFIIVLIGAAISASSAAMMSYRFGAASTGIAVGLVAPFIWWFLFAGAFYALSIFSGGVGSFRRVLEFTGYGFAYSFRDSLMPYSCLYSCRSSHRIPNL